ncbi:MAG TPA: hypothetical protein DHV36_14030 [Desulfobacteraceae bacterium]|nr:hypothetical protein [Desulfobacteraceae bacterium]
MRLISYLLLFTLFSVTGIVAGEIRDPYGNIDYFRLKNGLQVYLLNDAKAVNTQVSVIVNVGTKIENDDTCGLSHLVEHMVFRDRRVPHRDYLDYLEEEGATYVNGFTYGYATEFQTVIDSSKSYWLVETISGMLFDKQLDDQDLSAELGAIQTEIGEEKWYEKPLWYFFKSSEKLFPPKDDFYKENFGVAPPEEAAPLHKIRQTYRSITLSDVLDHYNTYYYPANTILKVAGNFDPGRMTTLIRRTYGSIVRQGTETAKPPVDTPVLNNRPHFRFVEGTEENLGLIGAMYVLDDYKKYIVLDAYVSHLAQRLQQVLRNERGDIYTISPYHFGRGKSMVASVRFDGLRKAFETNIATVRDTIEKDRTHLSDETIREALKRFEKTYTAIEHDSDSLMEMIGTAQYLREKHGIEDRTSYDIFRAISHEEFRKIVQAAFTPSNTYSYINRDYYFFPVEMTVISIITFVLYMLAYFNVHRIDRWTRNISYSKRDILMTRRLSSRLSGFAVYLICVFFASLADNWIEFLGQKHILGDAFFRRTIDVPHSYILTITDPLMYLTIFLFIYRFTFRYFARMDVVEDAIYLLGNRIQKIRRDEITCLEVVPWTPRLFFRTAGYAIFFWKPVLKIETASGHTYFLRAANAAHLKEDLEKCMTKSLPDTGMPTYKAQRLHA